MKFEDFENLLKEGFDTKKLATALNCSVNRLNELKRKPIVGEVYDDKKVNLKAIYDFAIKYNIDLNLLDYTDITTKTEHKRANTIYNEIKVGDSVYVGGGHYAIVDSVTNMSKQTIYIVVLDNGRYQPFNAKQLKQYQKELFMENKGE